MIPHQCISHCGMRYNRKRRNRQTGVFRLPPRSDCFGLDLSTAGIAAMNLTSQKLASPTRDWIERQFDLFHTIIPASSEDVGCRRTSYFYRKEAIAWARMSRERWPSKTLAALCARLAKSYLAAYRKMKTPRSAPPFFDCHR